MVEPGGRDLAGLQCRDEGVRVVQLRPGGVDVHGAVLHGGELLGADHPRRLGCHRRVHRDDVGLGQQVVELVRGRRVVGIERDDLHAQAREPPGQRLPDRTQADDAGGLPRDLPRPVPLIRDRSALVDAAVANVAVGLDHVAVQREEQRHRHLGHGVGVAAGGTENGDLGRGRGGDVDVVRVTAARAESDQPGHVEHRLPDLVGLDDDDRRPLRGGPLGQLVGGVEAQRLLLDPRVQHDVGDLPERLEALAAERGGDEGPRLVRHGGNTVGV